MNNSPKANDTEKKNERAQINNEALFFFVKCYMQNMPHGDQFITLYNSIAKQNPDDLKQEIFQFNPDSKEIQYYGIKPSDSPGSGLPAARMKPWKKERSDSPEGGVQWPEDIFKVMEFNRQKHLKRRREGETPPEIDMYINYMNQYCRIPTLDVLNKIQEKNKELSYEKDYKSDQNRADPASQVLFDFFKEGPHVPRPLVAIMASYNFDPVELIEKYLVSKIDSKTGECCLTLQDFLEIEKILHPEIAAKIEKVPDKKIVPDKSDEPQQDSGQRSRFVRRGPIS